MIRFKLAAANKILVQVGVKVRAEYSRNVKENFQSSLMRTDFGEPTIVVALINVWVEEQTHGTIKDLVSMDMLTRNIYFKAEWRHWFVSAMTEECGFFTGSREKQIRVQMMRHETGTRSSREWA